MSSNDRRFSMYVVTGATGNVRKATVQILLQHGQKVRAIARDRSRLQALAERGAEIGPGSLEDRAFLKSIFEGARAVLTMIPADPQTVHLRAQQDRIGEALTAAVQDAGVRYVVNVSSIGGDLPADTGPIAGLHAQEERLNQIADAHILHLRPAYFME